jgi:YggT family protein
VTATAALYLAARTLVVAALAFAVLVAATHWAVRRRRLNAFAAWPRLVRRASDPVLHPIERRLLRMGGNPQDAPLWLVGLVIAAGLVLLWLLGLAIGLVAMLAGLAQAGPAAWVLAAARAAFAVIEAALVVRVVASWLGMGRLNRWIRPAYLLTDWLVEPLRRVLPPLGPLDLSPMIAWILLSWVLQPLVLSLLTRLVLTP